MSSARVQHARAALQADPTQAQRWVDYVQALLDAAQMAEADKIIALAAQKGLAAPVLQDLARRQAQAQRQLAASTIAAPGTTVSTAAPNQQEVHQLAGLFEAKRYAELVPLAQRMTARYPGFAFGWSVLGAALTSLHRHAQALQPTQMAAQLMPGEAKVHYNLGKTLNELQRHAEAETSLRLALRLDSELTPAHYQLGLSLQAQGQSTEAEHRYRTVLLLDPLDAQAHNNLGIALNDQSRRDEAEECFRQALKMDPAFEDACSNLLFVLNYHPDKPAEKIYEAYEGYERQFAAPLRREWTTHARAPAAGRRLRIGYVSPDFKQHSVRHFLEPLLAAHDCSRVEVFAYAELAFEDAVTARYRTYCDHFILTRGMSDEALAARIRADAIDVLVDVAGHTAHNRLLVFARKPAPVLLSWMGYGYTTGLKAIDYLLTDEASAPADSEHLFSEAPWRLASTPYVYRPDAAMGEVSSLPALSNGFVTFGTLTRAIRINHRTVRVWAEILKRVPGSRLVIDSKNFQNASMQDAMAERFAEHGIARERLLIGCHSPPWDTLRSIDIGLDCFPHNSGTTLFETLYMGMPYVTLAGRPSVGRLGKSILAGLGQPEWLEDWCADGEEAYIDKAVALASDLPALSRIRAELRPQMQRSALMDEAGFARRVEDAYTQMFARWQAEHSPSPTAQEASS